MNKKKIGIILGIAIVAIVGIVGAKSFLGNKEQEVVAETVTISHDLGEVEVPVKPERVVTLNYAALDILEEMELEEVVVGTAKDGLPSYLEEYNNDNVTNVGGLKEFSLETINELNPDLIIIEGRQADYYEDLNAIAPTIQLSTDDQNFVGTLERNVTVLGQIFDEEDLASEKIGEVTERLEAISTKVKSEGINALGLMVSDGAMSVFGYGSRFECIYKDFGFEVTDTNIEATKHGQNVSYEYLLSKNPDYLFVVDKAEATGAASEPSAAKAILDNELVKSTDTYKNNNIIYLDGAAWYVGGAGLQAVDLMIKDMENAIQ